MGEGALSILKIIEEAMAGHAAAFRCVTEYQPVGGVGDKVFPPTYEGGKYAVEKRMTDGGETVDCVLLDSVQSQANRMELALLEACRSGRIKLPLVTVRFEPGDLREQFQDKTLEAKGMVITSLEAPHRVADAIFRDSLENKKPFRQSERGRLLDTADVRNATGLFAINPTSLVFGLWDSTGPRGGLGAKFQRALVSEIVGYRVQEGISTGSRIDPLGITRAAGPVFRKKQGGWTTDANLAETVGGKPALFGLSKGKLVAYDETKDQDQGAPSKINHGNVTPDFAFAKDANNNNLYDEINLDSGRVLRKPRVKGGYTMSHAKQTTVISLVALRRLRFPIQGSIDSDPKVDLAARTVLASLALLGAVLAREEGADLRSRCQLYPTQDFIWELLNNPGEKHHTTFSLTGNEAVAIFNSAVEAANAVGLPWEGEIALEPSKDLVKLVARSQELAMHQAIQGEE